MFRRLHFGVTGASSSASRIALHRPYVSSAAFSTVCSAATAAATLHRPRSFLMSVSSSSTPTAAFGLASSSLRFATTTAATSSPPKKGSRPTKTNQRKSPRKKELLYKAEVYQEMEISEEHLEEVAGGEGEVCRAEYRKLSVDFLKGLSKKEAELIMKMRTKTADKLGMPPLEVESKKDPEELSSGGVDEAEAADNVEASEQHEKDPETTAEKKKKRGRGRPNKKNAELSSTSEEQNAEKLDEQQPSEIDQEKGKSSNARKSLSASPLQRNPIFLYKTDVYLEMGMKPEDLTPVPEHPEYSCLSSAAFAEMKTYADRTPFVAKRKECAMKLGMVPLLRQQDGGYLPVPLKEEGRTTEATEATAEKKKSRIKESGERRKTAKHAEKRDEQQPSKIGRDKGESSNASPPQANGKARGSSSPFFLYKTDVYLEMGFPSEKLTPVPEHPEYSCLSSAAFAEMKTYEDRTPFVAKRKECAMKLGMVPLLRQQDGGYLPVALKEEGTTSFSKARYLYRTEVYEKMGVAAGDLVSHSRLKGYSRISDAAFLRNYPTDENREQYKKDRVLMSKTLDLLPLVRQTDGSFKKLVAKSPDGKILIQGEKRRKEAEKKKDAVLSKPDEAEAAEMLETSTEEHEAPIEKKKKNRTQTRRERRKRKAEEEEIINDKNIDNASSPPAEERNASVEGGKKQGRLVFETKVYLKMGFNPEEDLVAVPGHSNYSTLSDAAMKKGYLRTQYLHDRTKTAIELKCPPLKISSDGSTKVVKPEFRVDLLFRDEVYAKMDFTSKDLLPVEKHPGYSELKPEVFDLEMSRPRKKDEMSFYSRRRAAAIELNMPPVKELGAGRSISPVSSAGASASGTEASADDQKQHVVMDL